MVAAVIYYYYHAHNMYISITIGTTIISYPCTFVCVYAVYCNCCTCNLQLVTFCTCIAIAPVFFPQELLSNV